MHDAKKFHFRILNSVKKERYELVACKCQLKVKRKKEDKVRTRLDLLFLLLKSSKPKKLLQRGIKERKKD